MATVVAEVFGSARRCIAVRPVIPEHRQYTQLYLGNRSE